MKEGHDYFTSFYYVFQILASGGYDDNIDTAKSPYHAVVLVLTMLTGLMVFAVLVGFVNDSVQDTIEEINQGKSKIVARGHTLILGWNESTVRVVIQIAFLRRAFQMRNETWSRKLFWWTRVKPSTPVAANPVVILCNTKTKQEMDHAVEEALLESGIPPWRARVGWDIVCRIGDPTDPHDLYRVAAQNATSIMVMMTEHDEEESEKTNGIIQNGATLCTLLSLRTVRFSNENTEWDNFRGVLHLQQTSC